jgi:hypothetical protein
VRTAEQGVEAHRPPMAIAAAAPMARVSMATAMITNIRSAVRITS